MSRRVQFDRYGPADVLQVADVPRPQAGEGQILVQVVAAGINPGEIAIRNGALEAMFPAAFPSGQGSDFAGRVVETGQGVTEFAPGDGVLGWSDRRRADVRPPGRGRCLQDSTQADIDAWYATATDPDATRTFLKWAIASRAMPRLDVPARRHAEQAPISQHRRLALIHRFLTDKRIELRTRVAGCLLLLYAQPVSRLARLTLDDISPATTARSSSGWATRRLQSPNRSPRCSPNWPPTA